MFFYLQWKDRRPESIQLLNNIPKEINFSETFKVKGVEHTICGWINPTFHTYYPPVKKTHKKKRKKIKKPKKFSKKIKKTKKKSFSKSTKKKSLKKNIKTRMAFPQKKILMKLTT